MDRQEAIVCVDDEVIILMALKLEIARSFKDRFRMETALNAQDALRLIDELEEEGIRVKVLLTDWLMPGLRGDQLIALVKNKHPETKCILISGQADEEAIENAQLNPLLDAFVRKPWLTAHLLDSVARCVAAG